MLLSRFRSYFMITPKHRAKPAVTGPPSGSLAKLRNYYKSSEGYRAHLRAKGPAYFEQFVHVVCASSLPGDRILDVGCGAGESTRELVQRNRNVVGTDLSMLFMNADRVSATTRPAYVTSDASQLPFADHTFDVVCAMEFIEHVWPVHTVLSEIDRVLKPSGRIVIMSPNLLSPLWPVRDLAEMVLHHRFRPPLYDSYGEAASFFQRSCRLSLSKILSQEPQFVPREPDLTRADGGGDFDSVYASNARDISLFLQQAGYGVAFAPGPRTSLRSWVRTIIANGFGSLWTSFLLKATKVRASGSRQ
jgi:SAM-dependent methyltransferase